MYVQTSTCPVFNFLYSNAAPTNVNAIATPATYIGLLSMGPSAEPAAEFLLVVDVGLAVLDADPEPGVAVPVEVPLLPEF